LNVNLGICQRQQNVIIYGEKNKKGLLSAHWNYNSRKFTNKALLP